MGKVLLTFVAFAIYVYALVDLVRSPRGEVRTLPKWLWAVVILVLGPIGCLLWFLLGRPRVGFPPAGGGGGGGGGIGSGPRPPRGPVAPDDDPEFLKRLDEQSWAARMERLRRERQARGPAGGQTPADPTPGGPGEGGDPA